jgi:hypothetical protein
MLSILGYKGNANQNIEISPHSSQNCYHQKHKQQQMPANGLAQAVSRVPI